MSALDKGIKVCLGCHASYNDGYLFDMWYTISDEIDLDDALVKFEKRVISCIKKERPEWIKDGYISDTYAEELYIADSEVYIDGEFLSIDFNECIGSLRDFLEILETNYSYPLPLLIEVMKNRGAGYEDLKEIDDNILVLNLDSNSNSDLAHAYVEMTGLFDQYENCDTLKNYFDYDSYGRDLKMEFTVYEIGNNYYAVSDN